MAEKLKSLAGFYAPGRIITVKPLLMNHDNI
jgi:hypothetical protein